MSRTLVLAVGLTAALPIYADEACTGEQFQAVERVADSLRPDKPGLARVFAYDGTEFTAGQSLWIKGRLSEVEAACAHRDNVAAAQHLESIQALIQAHRR